MLEAVIGVSLGLVTTFLIILLLLLLWLLEPTMSITERERGGDTVLLGNAHVLQLPLWVV